MKILRKICLFILIASFLISGITYAQNPADENYDKGIEYAVEGRFKKAKKEFEKALKLDPFYEDAKTSLGIIAMFTKKDITKKTAMNMLSFSYIGDSALHDRVIRRHTRTIRTNPKDADAYYNRGKAYKMKKQYARAVRDFTKFLKINPNNAAAYYNRGDAYSENGQHARSIRDFNKAIEINPKYANAYDNRGVVYFVKLGNKAKGCADFKKACKLGECENYNIGKRKGLCP